MSPEAPWRNRIVGSDQVPPGDLLANPNNWRTHPGHQRAALRGVLTEVGWVQQVIVNTKTGHMVDGHARVEEALARKEPTVPVLYVELEADEEGLILATLDPIGAMADRDGAKLDALLADVVVDDEGLRALLAELADRTPKLGQTDPDDTPAAAEDPYVKPGELYALGDHRLLCGDSTSADSYARLMAGQLAVVLVTDPPYGVAYRDTGAGAWDEEKLAKKRAGTLKPRFQAIAGDELDGAELTQLWVAFLTSALEHLDKKASVYCCFASLRAPEVFAAFDQAGLEARSELVWVKSRPAFNFAHYKHQHEPMLYGARKGGSVHWYGDRAQTSLLPVPSEAGSAYLHPTQKPVALLTTPIANSSRAGDIVLEPFSGSGSTIIAAEQLGRRCFAIDLDPRYVQVAIERWERFTGHTAERIDG